MLLPGPIANKVPRRILLLGACVIIITAWFSLGTHHADEHFQILEFAGARMGLSPRSELPWEFTARMRPAFQPLLVVLVHRTLALFGSPDPFLVAFILRLLSGVLWFMATLLLLRAFLPAIPDAQRRRWLILLSFFLWFVVYNAVRFSSENWSGCLVVIGIALLLKDRSVDHNWLLAGLALGLAFVVRMQSIFMIAGFVAWLMVIAGARARQLALLIAAASVAVCVGAAVDRWYYGEWVCTACNYFTRNILEGKASGYGTEPWWYYFAEAFERGVPPFSLLFILAPLVLFLFDRKGSLTWTILPFVLVHCLVPHKEMRFLFPVLAFLPIVIVQAIELAGKRWFPILLEGRALRIGAKTFWAVNIVLLVAVMFKPANADVLLFRKLYYAYPGRIRIHAFDKDPYKKVDAIHYYTRPDWVMAGRVTDATYFDPSTTLRGVPFLITTRHPADVEGRWRSARLVYRSLPAWVNDFNFNGWVERTGTWYVYEVVP